jgi:ketosteroid isomerase-like protein
MRRLTTLLLLLLAGTTVLRADPAADEAAIRAVLAAQSAAWNRGDIDGFMQGYWQSDDLRFASGGTITKGWRTTLERYRAHYPDKAAMGRLTFTLHEIHLLAPDAAVVFGKWELAREKDHPWGLFTLILRKFPEGWRVTADHTSSGS